MADFGKTRGTGGPRTVTADGLGGVDFDVEGADGSGIDSDISDNGIGATPDAAYIALRQFLEPLLSRVT